MIEKSKRKIALCALAAVAALLFAALGAVNLIAFASVSSEADERIAQIKTAGGVMEAASAENPDEGAAREGLESARYFTFAFSGNKVREVAFRFAEEEKEECEKWARELLANKGGWTRGDFRFSVYRVDKEKWVTVLDCGRELRVCRRVLWVSAAGFAVLLVLAAVATMLLVGRLLKPLESGEAAQKQFVADAARELKNPLTVLYLEAAEAEKAGADAERMRAVFKELDKLNALTKNLNRLACAEKGGKREKVDLSALCRERAKESEGLFAHRGVAFQWNVAEGATVAGDEELLEDMVHEALLNAAKFAKKDALMTLAVAGERITFTVENDAEGLADGAMDRVFDRFFKEGGAEGNGLGLSLVKDIALLHGGRAAASVKDGRFLLKIEL